MPCDMSVGVLLAETGIKQDVANSRMRSASVLVFFNTKAAASSIAGLQPESIKAESISNSMAEVRDGACFQSDSLSELVSCNVNIESDGAEGCNIPKEQAVL